MSGFAKSPAGARKHHCHAEGCEVTVPPRLLMCGRHWAMVSSELQAEVLATYRLGQENDMRPSIESLDAMENAINHIRRLEGKHERPLPSVLIEGHRERVNG